MAKAMTKKKKETKTKDNNEQELKIDDLNLDLEEDQWELIVEKTYNTVKNETQYRKMSLDEFQRVIFLMENNKMLDGKTRKGMKLDWQQDIIEPMYQTFIDSVNIILYYFISYYLIRF